MAKHKTLKPLNIKKTKILFLGLAILTLLISALLYQKFSSSSKETDLNGYCVPLKDGSFTLKNGQFEDYLNGYTFNLSQFPDAIAYDPVCKNFHYHFELVKDTQTKNTSGYDVKYPATFTIFPAKEASTNVDLIEFAVSGIDPAFKDSIDRTRKAYQANAVYGKTDKGDPYIRIYNPAGTYNRENYDYYLNTDNKVISISFNPGLASKVNLAKFEQVIKSFKINEDLTKNRKTILD